MTLSFNLRPGVALGDAVDAVQDLADKTLPARVSTHFSGTAKAFQDSLRNMSLLLLIAIAVVYIVLGILYESFIHPLTILSGLPAAGFGALLTLLSVQSRAHHLCLRRPDHADRHREEERDHADRFRPRSTSASTASRPEQAIVEGCLVRFRPILMTTLAALFGSLPIALGSGPGAKPGVLSAWPWSAA